MALALRSETDARLRADPPHHDHDVENALVRDHGTAHLMRRLSTENLLLPILLPDDLVAAVLVRFQDDVPVLDAQHAVHAMELAGDETHLHDRNFTGRGDIAGEPLSEVLGVDQTAER